MACASFKESIRNRETIWEVVSETPATPQKLTLAMIVAENADNKSRTHP